MSMQTQFPVHARVRSQALSVPFLGHAVKALWQTRVLVALMLLQMTAGVGIAFYLGVPFVSGTASRLATMLFTIIPCFLVFLMFWRFGYMAIYVRPESPTRWFLADFR